VITTKEQRDKFIAAGSEIATELKEIFGDGPITFADIGACDGLSSIIYSQLFPGSTGVAFEPLPENCADMMQNFHDYNVKIEINMVALSNKVGEAAFFKSSGQAPKVDGWDTGNKSSSLLRPKRHVSEHPWCKFSQVKVTTTKLDNYKYRFDFIHMDVQGAELMVMKGGEKTLRTAKAIWIEVSNIELYANQALKPQVSHFLTHLGFKCRLDTCGNRKYGDMLWFKE
jgi:FkbM family methyltransferase